MTSVENAILLKQELDALRPLSKADEMRIMQKFRLDWNYHSNHLEGNTLTYGETKALILFGITAQGKTLQEHFEVTGHDEAIKWVLDVIKQKYPLTENFIRELHQLILKEPYERDAITPDGQPTKKLIQVGVYKSTPNHVRTRTGEMFYFATPEETPAKMHDLIQQYRAEAEREGVEPILLAAKFHYDFIRIHPFDDGNGRTARILMNFILMKFGYPPVIIKTEDKENYFAALRQADAGILEPFIEYIGANLVRSLEIMIKGAKGESVEDEDDLEKEIALFEQKLITKSKDKQQKNIKSILSVYDSSIKKLATEYFGKMSLFKKLYEKYYENISIDGKGIKSKDKGIIDSNRINVSNRSQTIVIRSSFLNLKSKKKKKFELALSITFRFNKEYYSISSSSIGIQDSLRKKYDEEISKEEIDYIVGKEVDRHKRILREKINS